MKRPGDMKRRREASYRRGWRDLARGIMEVAETMAQAGRLPLEALGELRVYCANYEPDDGKERLGPAPDAKGYRFSNKPPPHATDSTPLSNPKSPWLAVPKRDTT